VGADGAIGLLLSDRTVLGTPLANRVAGVDGRIRLGDPTVVQASALGATTTFADGTERTAPAGSAEIAVSARHPFFESRAEAIGPGFRAENGYVPWADRIGGATRAGLVLYPGSAAIPTVTLTPVDLRYAWTTDGRLRELGGEASIGLDLGNGTALELSAVDRGEAYGGAWLRTRTGAVSLGGPWARWLEAEVAVEAGLAPYYDPADPREGFATRVDAAVAVRPVPSLSLGAAGSAERFEEGGAIGYQGIVAQGRAEWMLSRTLSARTIVDLSTFSDLRRAEALLAWERSPGTALYAGGSRTLDGEWTLFLKASVLLSP
jgi:hypothetical protein